MAFCRSITLRCLLRSQAGLACCVCGGVERASCARSRVVLCVWRRRLPLRSHRRELSGARHHLACHCPRRRHRHERGAAALNMCMLCCSRMPSAHGPHRLWTAAACARLLAAGVARDKWQIQKWPFPTVWALAARALLFDAMCCELEVLSRARSRARTPLHHSPVPQIMYTLYIWLWKADVRLTDWTIIDFQGKRDHSGLKEASP